MKSIYKILAALLLICTASCKKELHKTPIGIITEGIAPTHESVIYSVTSTYQLLSNTLNIIGDWGWDDGTVLRNDFILQDIASGDMQKKWNPMATRHGWTSLQTLVLPPLTAVLRAMELRLCRYSKSESYLSVI